jgi:hypothetical protein
MAGRSILYWDSCAFLALLKKEQQHGPDELPALEHMASDFDQGLIYLASSTITILEVLSANVDDEKRAVFEGVLQRSNFVLVEANESVMRDAARVRKYYHHAVCDGEGKPLIVSSPDAIHVASAIAIEAEELITLDCKNKPKQREMGLIQLGAKGKILGTYAISIKTPAFGTSGQLFYGKWAKQREAAEARWCASSHAEYASARARAKGESQVKEASQVAGFFVSALPFLKVVLRNATRLSVASYPSDAIRSEYSASYLESALEMALRPFDPACQKRLPCIWRTSKAVSIAASRDSIATILALI